MKNKQSKLDKLMVLNGEAYESRNPLSKVKNRGKVSLLCATIWLLAEHTKYEMDAKDIIVSIYPEFFNTDMYSKW